MSFFNKNYFFFFLISIVAGSSFANTTRSISVTGKCSVDVPPDRTTVTFVSTFTEKQSQTAAKKATDTYESVRQDLQKMGLKDLELQTTNFNISEQFDYSGKKPSSIGFQASMGLMVSTSDMKRMGEVLALSQKYNIQRTENFSSYLSDKLMKASVEGCLAQATQNAKEKADKIAGSVSAKVGELISLSEGSVNQPRPPMMMAESYSVAHDMAKSVSVPTIENRSQTISVEVHAQFALK
jgi:uncharacterized protein